MTPNQEVWACAVLAYIIKWEAYLLFVWNWPHG
jgi:hypothetical protein